MSDGLVRMEDALQFAKRSRVLLMRHTTSGIDVDITFGELPFERAAVANCENHDIGGVRVRLPRVQDLLVMKAIARRPKDVQDLQGLLAAHPEVDVASARLDSGIRNGHEHAGHIGRVRYSAGRTSS